MALQARNVSRAFEKQAPGVFNSWFISARQIQSPGGSSLASRLGLFVDFGLSGYAWSSSITIMQMA